MTAFCSAHEYSLSGDDFARFKRKSCDNVGMKHEQRIDQASDLEVGADLIGLESDRVLSPCDSQTRFDGIVRAYDLVQAARRLNVSTKTIRRWIYRGLLRRCNATRKILIPAEDVDGFFQAHSKSEWER